MKRIGIWGFFGEKNFGDDLLLMETVKLIRNKEPDSDITIFCGEHHPEVERCCYVSRTIKSSIQNAFVVDCFIIGPGGLLPNYDPMKIIFFILIGLIVRLRGKRLLLWGLGIGAANLNRCLSKLLLVILFRFANQSVIRQDLSRHFSSTVLSRWKVETGCDLLLSENSQLNTTSNKTETVVFSLANVFPDKCKVDLVESFVYSIAKQIEKIIQMGYSVTLIGLSNRTDFELNQRILDCVGDERCRVVNYIDRFDPVIEEISAAKLVVAMRFHALVASIQSNTPVYCLAYDEKTEDLCRRIGIDDYCQKVCFSNTEYYGEILPLNIDALDDGIKRIFNDYKNAQEKMKKGKVYCHALSTSIYRQKLEEALTVL